MRRTRLAFLLSLSFAAAVCADFAHGQTQTSSGLFGSRNVGGGITAGGSSAFGNRGAQQGGATGTPGALVEQAQQGAGQAAAGDRFVRDSRQAGAFVGADSGDNSQFNSIQQAGGRNMRNNQFSQFNQLSQFMRNSQQFNNNQNNQNRGQRTRAQVPVALRLGFDPPAVPTGQVQTRISGRIERSLNLGAQRSVSVTVQGRTAVLQGSVATEHEKTLAERLAMLEPGVSRVQNEVTVRPAR